MSNISSSEIGFPITPKSINCGETIKTMLPIFHYEEAIIVWPQCGFSVRDTMYFTKSMTAVINVTLLLGQIN